jgi:hypothetical protein
MEAWRKGKSNTTFLLKVMTGKEPLKDLSVDRRIMILLKFSVNILKGR